MLIMERSIDAVLSRRSDRAWRRAGLAIALLGIPAFFVYRSSLGATMGAVLGLIHVYCGAVLALLFPWLRKRLASDRDGAQ